MTRLLCMRLGTGQPGATLVTCILRDGSPRTQADMWSRLSTDGQSVGAQVRQLTKAGCKKVFREVASGAKTDRAQLRRLLDELEEGDVLSVTRLARSTRDLLNTLAAITAKKAGFKSIGDTWADTTTSHGRLMMTVLGGLAEFERDLIRARTGEGRARAVARGQRMGRPPKLTAHQQKEEIKRRDQGETLADIAAATTSARRRFRGSWGRDRTSQLRYRGSGACSCYCGSSDSSFPFCSNDSW